jgi:hypothetical protein
MKKLVLFLFTALISITLLNAQEPGYALFGGNCSFVSELTESESIIRFSFSPIVGMMISSKVAIGVAVGINYLKYDNEYTNYSDSKELIFAPFVRFHNNITENLKYYIEPSFGKTFMFGDESEHKTQKYNADINFGLLYFISPHVSLEIKIAGISYSHMSDKDDDMKENIFSIDNDLVNPNIGLKYYF